MQERGGRGSRAGALLLIVRSGPLVVGDRGACLSIVSGSLVSRRGDVLYACWTVGTRPGGHAGTARGDGKSRTVRRRLNVVRWPRSLAAGAGGAKDQALDQGRAWVAGRPGIEQRYSAAKWGPSRRSRSRSHHRRAR